MFCQSIKTESEMLNFKPKPGMLHPVFSDERLYDDEEVLIEFINSVKEELGEALI